MTRNKFLIIYISTALLLGVSVPSIMVKAIQNTKKEIVEEPIIPTKIKVEEIETLNEVKPISPEREAFIAENSFDDVKRCFEVATSLVGRRGSCLSIVKAFIKDYFGPDVKFMNKYRVDEPKMGDIIYYDDGGAGGEHWAIYIDANHSLQGNFNGRCIIMEGINLSSCKNPIFYRVM